MWGLAEDNLVNWVDDDPTEATRRKVREATAETSITRDKKGSNDGDSTSLGGTTEEQNAARLRTRTMAAASFASLRVTREHIIQQMHEQVTRAVEDGISTNQALAGDNRIHTMLLTLLPANMQREVFMAIVSREAAYPRVRKLFGAPPYAFLRVGDAGMLRAAGFAPSRRNVAYDSFRVANYAQFGLPHLLDTYGRQYRVAQENDGEDSPVAYMALRRDIIIKATFVVRIKKYLRSHRAATLNDAEGKEALSFPRVGEVVHMQPTPAILRMMAASMDDNAAVDVRIVEVHRLAPKASTAVVLGVTH